MTVRFSVTVRQVLEDGSEAPVEGEVAAALASPRRSSSPGWRPGQPDEARFCDHGEREKVIGEEGQELQRRLLQAAFDIDSAREQRAAQVTSAAGIRRGTVEAGHGRGVTSVFGPVPASPGWPTGTGASRTCTRPTPGRSCPMTRTPWGCGPWRPSTWPRAGSGRPRR